ncbi:MAG: PAS domain-containing protein, partial [Magnetospirillum sp.]|nr:PAS domain-containing protein [Magnetospirillum sp.]
MMASAGLGGIAILSRHSLQRAQARNLALEREIGRLNNDIDALSEAQHGTALAASRLSCITDGTSELIAAIDPHLRLTVMNRAFLEEMQQMLGHAPTMGQTIGEVLAPLGPEGASMERAWNCALAGEAFTLTAELGNPDCLRNIYEMAFSPLRGEDGRVIGAVQFARDVSLREHAERRLRTERDLSQAVIDSLPGIFYLLGQSGRLLRWNKNLETVSASTAEQLACGDPLDFFTGDDRNTIAQAIDEVRRCGRSEAEAVLVSRDGRRTPYLFIARRITVESQPCVIGTGLDISLMKRAEAALAEKSAALEASNAELEQFAYVASHDLREPLRMVSAYMGLLERRYGEVLDADAHEFIGFAKDGAARMDLLIVDLLEYSRVGRKRAPFAVFSVAEAIALAQANLAAAIAESCALLRIQDTLPQLEGDQGEIVRLFQNIIANAIKYRHPERQPIIAITCRKDGESWRFTIADNGIGIPEADRERVFQIFQRLHSHSEYEGTGIGLALCRKIVERHGGHMWMEASAEAGSAVIFTLPDSRESRDGLSVPGFSG